MGSVRYLTLDVFTSEALGGNQLAVFPDARGIPEELLLPIVREFNYSETTFCYPPADPAHAARVRIFTPGGELPFAGHPTIGTAVALALGGDRSPRMVLEEGVGPVPVRLDGVGEGRGYGELSVAKLPEVGPQPPSRGTLAKILGLATEDVLGGSRAPQALSCGIPFLLVPLRDVDAVSRARVRLERWEEVLKSYWAPDILVFAPDESEGPRHFRARMFGPGVAVPEDPATGSAIACLGGYLGARERAREGSWAWTVDQGIEMGRPSRLDVSADKAGGAVTAIRVGGWAVQVMSGELRLPH